MFMKKEIALSIEQMKHLQDLGLDCSGASMSYLSYKDITDEWVEEEDFMESHFKHDETSVTIISLELGYNKLLLYSDMSECSNYTCCEVTPAFCLHDILELLPRQIREYKLECDCHGYIAYVDYVASDDEEDGTNNYKVEGDTLHCVFCKELITASYEMLLWCIDNGYVKTNKTK